MTIVVSGLLLQSFTRLLRAEYTHTHARTRIANIGRQRHRFQTVKDHDSSDDAFLRKQEVTSHQLLVQ